MDQHEEIATVLSYRDGIARIRIERGGGCKSCSLSSICGPGNKCVEIDIPTELELKENDRVQVTVSPGMRIFSSFLIFVFPLIMMVFFYLISRYLIRLTENFSILSSFIGLIISGIVIAKVDKKLASKLDFKIIGKVK